MKRVLITGGNGFIGSYLHKYLNKKEYRDLYDTVVPQSIDLDVMKAENWNKFADCQINCVVHLAGKTFVPYSWEKPDQFFDVNTVGTLNALYFCKKNNIPMTYVSAYVYGTPNEIPLREDSMVEPNNPYAASKYLGEEACRLYARLFGMDITVLRLFNVYGGDQKADFLIPTIMNQCSDSDIIKVKALSPKRDYVYISDVCEAIRLSTENYDGYRLYNVGSGISYSVEDVINTIEKVLGCRKKIESEETSRVNEIDDVVADIRCIKHELGWIPKVTFEEGIKRMIEVDI